MRLRSSIALAAMAAALATPQAVMAASGDAATQQQLQAALQKLAEMQTQLDALKAQVDQQAATQAQAQADAQATADKADRALAASDKPAKLADAMKWAADTKISGRMYFNVSNIANKYDGTKVQDQGGFQIKRFYVGIDHKFDDTFSGNVTMDIDNVANSSGRNVGKGFYVKKAFLKAKLDKALNVSLGATDMPWIPYVESLYGYRHIDKTVTDLFGYGTSADWGVHVGGDLAGGVVSYQVSAVDGGGYRDPKFTNTVDLEGRLSVAYKGFNAAVGGYTGKLGNDTDTTAGSYRTARRFNALLAYKDKLGGIPVTVGGEYFTAKNWKVRTTSPEDKAEGYSVFASVSPVERWAVFGRYDWLKPNKDTAPSRKANMFNVGVQYSPAKIVDLALIYKRYNGDNGFTGGDFIDSAVYADGKQDEFGLYGQFRF